MTVSKLDSLIERSGLDDIGHTDLKEFAQLIINECCLIIDSAAFHNLPPNKFAKLLKEELL